MIDRRLHAPLAVAVLLAACAAEESRGPRPELSGETGFGGVAVTVGSGAAGGAVVASSSAIGSSAASGGAGGAGGMGCSTFGEPNDTEGEALALGALSDCDSAGGTIVAALDGPGDVDWYRYNGEDNFGCVVDPTRQLSASGAVRLCKFARCVSGGTSVDCNNGSSAATAPNGWPGCCHSQGFELGIECDGVDDAADVLIRIDQGSAACVTYNLDYHN